MVELRWISRFKITDPTISGHHEERETVLQYRAADMGTNMLGQVVIAGDWLGWQDVPTVTEGPE